MADKELKIIAIAEIKDGDKLERFLDGINARIASINNALRGSPLEKLLNLGMGGGGAGALNIQQPRAAAPLPIQIPGANPNQMGFPFMQQGQMTFPFMQGNPNFGGPPVVPPPLNVQTPGAPPPPPGTPPAAMTGRRFARTGAVINAGMGIADDLIGAYADFPIKELRNKAQVSQTFGSLAERLRAGDLQLMSALGRPEILNMIQDVTGRTALKTGAGLLTEGIGGALQTAGGIGAMATSGGLGAVGGAALIKNGVGNLTGAITDYRAGRIPAEQARAIGQAINLQIANTPYNNMRLDEAQRLAAFVPHMRLTGGLQAFTRANELGAVAGMDRGEVAALQMGLRERLGTSGVNEATFATAAYSEAKMGIGRDVASRFLGSTLTQERSGAQASDELVRLIAKGMSIGIKDSKMKEELADALAGANERTLSVLSGSGKVGDLITSMVRNPDNIQEQRNAINATQAIENAYTKRTGPIAAEVLASTRKNVSTMINRARAKGQNIDARMAFVLADQIAMMNPTEMTAALAGQNESFNRTLEFTHFSQEQGRELVGKKAGTISNLIFKNPTNDPAIAKILKQAGNNPAKLKKLAEDILSPYGNPEVNRMTAELIPILRNVEELGLGNASDDQIRKYMAGIVNLQAFSAGGSFSKFFNIDEEKYKKMDVEALRGRYLGNEKILQGRGPTQYTEAQKEMVRREQQGLKTEITRAEGIQSGLTAEEVMRREIVGAVSAENAPAAAAVTGATAMQGMLEQMSDPEFAGNMQKMATSAKAMQDAFQQLLAEGKVDPADAISRLTKAIDDLAKASDRFATSHGYPAGPGKPAIGNKGPR